VALLATNVCAVLKVRALLLTLQLTTHLIPDDSHAYVVNCMRHAHPAALPFLLGFPRAAGGVSGADPDRARSLSYRLAGGQERESLGASPSGAATFKHLFRACLVLVVTAIFSSAQRLDPSLALGAIGMHAACFPERQHMTTLSAFIALSLVADAVWFLWAGLGSPLTDFGGLHFAAALIGITDWAHVWTGTRLEWLKGLPTAEMVSGGLTLFNLPLKIVIMSLALHARWQMRRAGR